MIEENFGLINLVYTELLVKSGKFPRIDFETFRKAIEEQDETLLQRAQLELVF